jgi:hypothetical protein
MRRFLLSAVTVWSLYAQVPANTPSGCAAVGVVFNVDLTRHALMVKDKTGFIATIDLPVQAAIHKMAVGGAKPGRIGLQDIHQGDLVCVEGNAEAKTFNKVSVVTRTDAQRAQREAALQWQASSVFGKILTIDAAAHQMAVAPLIVQNPPPPTQISLSPDVQYRAYPMTALRISDATAIAFSDLQQGDTVYVRGKGAPGDLNLQATLVVKGGMRGILGTLREVGNSSVRIQEFGTGRTLDISIPSSMTYRITRELTNAGGTPKLDESRLATIQFSDLQPGDTVMVLGVTDYDTNKGTGLGLISQFGHFGSVPSDSGNELSWFLAK